MMRNESNINGAEDTSYEEVEKILHKRTRFGKNHYYLKWKGFSDDHNTWEPAKNLDCDRLIKEYEKRVKEEKKFKKIRNDSYRIYASTLKPSPSKNSKKNSNLKQKTMKKRPRDSTLKQKSNPKK